MWAVEALLQKAEAKGIFPGQGQKASNACKTGQWAHFPGSGANFFCSTAL